MANKTLIANLGTRLDTVNSVHFSSKSDQTIRKGSSRPSPCRFCRSTSLRRWMTWSTCRWEPEKKEEIHWIYLVVNMEQKCSATFWVSKISIESSTERIYKGMPPWLLWNVPHFSDSVRQLCVNEGCWDTEVVSHGLARRKPKKSERCWKLDGKCVFVFGGCLVGDMLVFGVFLGVYRIRSNWCEYWIEPHQSFGMNPERESLCKSAIYPTKLVTSSSTRSPPNTSQVNDLQWFVLMFLCFSPN